MAKSFVNFINFEYYLFYKQKNWNFHKIFMKNMERNGEL